jgi:hypothetical protein
MAPAGPPLGTPISRSAPSGSHFDLRHVPADFRARECTFEFPLTRVIGADLEIGVPRGREREGAGSFVSDGE